MTIKQRLDFLFRGYYQDGAYIVSKEHGRYRRSVPFVRGMTLKPEQRSYITVTMLARADKLQKQKETT
jgi:hypothetical protein